MRTASINAQFNSVMARYQNRRLVEFRDAPMDYENLDNQLDTKIAAVQILLKEAIDRAAEEIRYNVQFKLTELRSEIYLGVK